MVERQLPKLHTRVRFPSPAPISAPSAAPRCAAWLAALAALASLALCGSAALAADPTPPAAGPPPTQAHELFGAGFLDFQRTGGKVVGVYVFNERPAKLVDAIPNGAVTHVLYAFLHICGPGALPKHVAGCAGKRDFQLADGPVDAEFNDAFARLKQRAPHVKVLASVGGWGGSDPFFHLANEADKRAVFAASAAEFLRAHPAFDGIDIDWEHPTNNGSANGVPLGKPEDGQGYADLMAALRQALEAQGKGQGAAGGRSYLLTSAINTTRALVDKVNYREAAKSLDLLFLMTYDFYGPWSATIGHHSTLNSSSAEADDSLAGAVRNLTNAGVPAAKLVGGVAMYGRGFTGVAAPTMGQGVTGQARQGSFPDPEGAAPYRDIAAKDMDAKGRGKGGYRTMYDQRTAGWYLYDAKTRRYLGYDDPRAVIAKGQFVRQQGLAGLFAWELSQDNGDLLNAMNVGLGNQALGTGKAAKAR